MKPPVDPTPGGTLERARHIAYLRVIPLVFVSYVIAYIDRTNVALAQLTAAWSLTRRCEPTWRGASKI